MDCSIYSNVAFQSSSNSPSVGLSVAPGDTYEIENRGTNTVIMGMLGAADGLVSLSVGATGDLEVLVPMTEMVLNL